MYVKYVTSITIVILFIITSSNDISFLFTCLMIPLMLAGIIGTNAVFGIYEFARWILSRATRKSICNVFQKIHVPAFIPVFISEAAQVAIHLCFAAIMAKTYLYLDFASALIKEEVTKTNAHELLAFYMVVFVICKFTLWFFKEPKTLSNQETALVEGNE